MGRYSLSNGVLCWRLGTETFYECGPFRVLKHQRKGRESERGVGLCPPMQANLNPLPLFDPWKKQSIHQIWGVWEQSSPRKVCFRCLLLFRVQILRVIFCGGVLSCCDFVRNQGLSGRVCGTVNRSCKAQWDSALLIRGEGWPLEVIT